jgi:hypothetical protein
MWLRCSAFLIGLMLGFTPLSLAAGPRQVAGFVLGAPISQYQDQLKMSTALPVRYQEYLTEVEIKDLPGIKNGYLVYGTCQKPHKVVKIRLKYENPSKEFFEKLLTLFEARFGKPDEYRGDAFQTFIAWKWSFKDQKGNQTSMILQHYGGDDDEYTNGNSVKLTLWSQIEAERLCNEKKTGVKSTEESAPSPPKGKVDFDFLVPK